MSQYLITIVGDEDVWEARSATDAGNERVGGAHRDFATALQERGHRIISGGELSERARARTVRGSGSSYVVTDGPYSEATEQMGGYYLIESDDLDDLLEVCGALSLTEPVVEVRPILGQTVDAPS